MLAGHIVLGAATYKAVEDKPAWLRWLLLIPAGFTTHWILDSVIAYHDYSLQHWYDWLILAINILAVYFLFSTLVVKRGRQSLGAVISGLWFWLCWDWEWLFSGRFLHLNDSPILSRYFPAQSLNPWSGMLEICFVLVYLVIAIPCRR